MVGRGWISIFLQSSAYGQWPAGIYILLKGGTEKLETVMQSTLQLISLLLLLLISIFKLKEHSEIKKELTELSGSMLFSDIEDFSFGPWFSFY